MDAPGPPARGRPARGGRRITTGTLVGGAAIALVVCGLVAVAVVGSRLKPASSAHPSTPASAGARHDAYLVTRSAPASFVRRLSSLSATDFAAAGDGAGVLPAVGRPGSGRDLIRLPAGPVLVSGGKPLVIFVAAEYCPYCAALRWPLVIALARFGSFHHLDLTASSPLQPFSDTPSVSFRAVTYSSRYLAFSATEEASNVCPPRDVVANPARDAALPSWESPPYICDGVSFRPLSKPAYQVTATMSEVDSIPNFTVAKAETIPFVDFGGHFAEAGTILSPVLFHGHDWSGVLASLSRPRVGLGQAVLSVANRFTAILCGLTHDRPGSTCRSPTVERAARSL